jgi:membrane protein DedA with SNARE-associated domain
VTGLGGLLLLGLAVLVASSVPFVPTGEMVSGAAALAAPSLLLTVGVFLLCWLCSAAGDTLLMSGARLLRRPLQGWLDRQSTKPRVEQTRRWLDRSAFSAVVTARLVPGTRAPVIIALGLSGASRRRFVVADLVGCGLWAALYTLAGAVGGRLSSHPLLAVTAAVVLAVAASTVAGRLIRRRQLRADQDPSAPTS